jgi:hypothetical protein
VSGVVFFNPIVAETLLMFGQTAQLYACTYMGLDSGLQPIEVRKINIFKTHLLSKKKSHFHHSSVVC